MPIELQIMRNKLLVALAGGYTVHIDHCGLNKSMPKVALNIEQIRSSQNKVDPQTVPKKIGIYSLSYLSSAGKYFAQLTQTALIIFCVSIQCIKQIVIRQARIILQVLSQHLNADSGDKNIAVFNSFTKLYSYLVDIKVNVFSFKLANLFRTKPSISNKRNNRPLTGINTGQKHTINLRLIKSFFYQPFGFSLTAKLYRSLQILHIVFQRSCRVAFMRMRILRHIQFANKILGLFNRGRESANSLNNTANSVDMTGNGNRLESLQNKELAKVCKHNGIYPLINICNVQEERAGSGRTRPITLITQPAFI